MNPMKRVGFLAGAAMLTLTGGSFAESDVEAQNDELRARISELESRLGAVESQSSDSWLTEQRADEIRELVADVLADAISQGIRSFQKLFASIEVEALPLNPAIERGLQDWDTPEDVPR